jgi:molybdenum cofactor biosynthesis enzyme MoaA
VVLLARCPLACSYCHMEGAPPGISATTPSPAEWVELIQAGLSCGIRKVKFLGGEPFLHPHLPQIVEALRARDPELDLSVITSGTVPVERLHACFEAGLSRANMSIHGWSAEAFAERKGNAALLRRRDAFLAALLEAGRPLKLNYVVSGPKDAADLGELLKWAAGRCLVVNVLNELGRAELGPDEMISIVTTLRGAPSSRFVEPDPFSLPTLHLRWDDGLEVEIKDQELGRVAPWRRCARCPVRSRCREGIHAVRLTHEGVLRTCMDRPDVGADLLGPMRTVGLSGVAQGWSRFLAAEAR